MAGQRRVGARSAARSRPRHARPSRLHATALLVAGGIAALSTAILLNNLPAEAESSSTTATLTLTGIRDSDPKCDISTGGTTVYVKPGGTVTFKAELAGLSVKLPIVGYVDISSSLIASFNDKLIIDGNKKHPHYIAEGKTFVWKNVPGGTHSLAWSANSVTTKLGVTIPLNLDIVHLPVGGKLNWVGSLKASKGTECGISIEVPGGGITIGPITVSVPPITSIPTVPVTVPSVPLPGGGSSSSGGKHHHGGGPGTSSPAPGGGSSVSTEPIPIPKRVVPNPGGGNSAFGGGGGLGGVGALPEGSIGPVAPAAITSTAVPPSSSSPKPKSVDLATNSTGDGMGGPQLPVLLAIVAIIALSLVTATYARMYLLRKPPAA